MTHHIAVDNQQAGVVLPRGYKSVIRRAASLTLSASNFDKRAEIGVTLVSPEEIRRLNLTHRKVDRPTDVLSFPLVTDPFHPSPEDLYRGSVSLGDVIVCPEVIREQANSFHVSFMEELSRMVIHSVLHLLGWDHAEKDEEKEMFALQEKILSELKRENEKAGV